MTEHKTQRAAIIILLLTALALGVIWFQKSNQNGSGSSGVTAGIDPQAKQLFGEMTAAYQKLGSFSVTITTEVSDSTDASLPTVRNSFTSEVLLRRPDQATVKIKGKESETQVVGDGKFLYGIKNDTPNQFIKEAVPAMEGGNGILATIMFANQLSGEGNIGPSPFVLSGLDLMQGLSEQMKSLSFGPPTTIDGVSAKTIIAVQSAPEGESKLTFVIGEADHLLRQVTFEHSIQGRVAGQMTETYTRLQPGATTTEQTFSFTPPAGAQQVAAVQAFQNSKYKPGTLPIPINTTDLAGNPVSLDQFKGKVVLLDFWATWCAPCRAELPNVIAAYTKYQKQGFEVLGISLDNANAQAALTQFIKENKMPWRQIYEGKGWEGTISSQYQVRSIPFTLLLGRDGRIAAVNVRGATLEPAIQQALAQKG